MSKFSIRVLVVDDFEPFRRFLCETLRARSDFEIVGEASDGQEAVRNASELQPDLVILDIGLPQLNGIEAAARISQSCPAAKILFVSQETSTDVLHRALAAGGQGYVVKTEAGKDLSNAIDAVLRGERFVSSRFSAEFTPTADTARPTRLPDDLAIARQYDCKVSPRHNILFYVDDEYFLNALAQFVGAALCALNSAIVIATESHRHDLLLRLQASGLDVGAAIEEGRYISLDAAGTGSGFMLSGKVNEVRVLRDLGDLFSSGMKAARGVAPRVAACGECSPVLCAEGNVDAAVQIERLTNRAAELHSVDILCCYPFDVFQGERGQVDLRRIRAEHSVAHRQ